MNFLSPQPTQFDWNFKLFGFPIRVTPWFWAVSAIMGANGDARSMLLWIVAVFIGILVHELGHAFAMRRYGFEPTITLIAFGGVTSYNPSNQINRRFLNYRDRVFIDVAGPLAGFALFVVLAGILLIIGVNPLHFLFGSMADIEEQSLIRFLTGPIILLIYQIMFICLFWGILNLVPVYPLDGGQIAREICVAYDSQNGIRKSFYLSFITSLILAGLAVLWLNSLFTAAFFGMFAYSSWQGMKNS